MNDDQNLFISAFSSFFFPVYWIPLLAKYITNIALTVFASLISVPSLSNIESRISGSSFCITLDISIIKSNISSVVLSITS